MPAEAIAVLLLLQNLQKSLKSGTIRTMVESGDLVIACGGGGIPCYPSGQPLKGRQRSYRQRLRKLSSGSELDADFLIILTAVEKVAINFGKPNEQWA